MIGAPVPIGSGMPAPQMGGTTPQQPPMMLNPDFMQWMKLKQAYDQEAQNRQQQFMAACELIKQDAPCAYKIDIEADSTIAADEQEEKAARTEFLKEMTPFLQAVIPGIMTNPAMAPLGKELGMFAVRAFKVSRQLEEAFEQAFDALAKQAGNSPPQPQSGKNTKSPMEVKAEAMTEQGKLQLGREENATKQMEIFADAQIERDKLTAEQQHNAVEIAMRARELQGHEAIEQARMSHMMQRDTKGIV